MNIIGIDLAKSIFHICVMNSRGKVLKRFHCSRSKLLESIIIFDPKNHIISMEACASSHYWGRKFEFYDFEVKLIAAQFVKPFLKSCKNDANDSEAICEATSRKEMRFVSVKREEQQDILSLHRIRERLVKNRTALANEIRGLLNEYGIIFAKGIHNLKKNLMAVIEEHRENKSVVWYETFINLYQELCDLFDRVKFYEDKIKAHSKSNEICKRLTKIKGVGPITASAITASVANPRDFKNGRQFAAWLGLVPRQNSSGGKSRLGGITKRGDRYIRKLLVQGAASVAISVIRKVNGSLSHKKYLTLTEYWNHRLREKKGFQLSNVALANKTARIIWNVLCGEEYREEEKLEISKRKQKLFKLQSIEAI